MELSESLVHSLLESDNPFPVNFDDAWEWIGYKKKQNGKDKLVRCFEEGVDYVITQMRETKPDGTFSHCWEKIDLAIDCFKSLAMMAGTVKGKDVRRYFLDCERKLRQVLNHTDQKPLTQAQIIAIAAQQLVAIEARQLEQDQRMKALESSDRERAERITAIEAEQDRFNAPCGHKYTVLGFASLHGIEMSRGEAATKGKQCAAICKREGVAIEKIYDPRFGQVNLYPQSILERVFVKTPVEVWS